MENLSLKQRFFSDTPTFFKKMHLLGLALIGIATLAAGYAFIPPKVPVIIGAIGATLALISQFAVEDTAIVKATIADPTSLLQHLPTLISQVDQIGKIINKASTDITSDIPPSGGPGVPEIKLPEINVAITDLKSIFPLPVK